MSSQSWKVGTGYQGDRVRDCHHGAGDFGLDGRVLLGAAIAHGVEPPEEFELGVLLKGAVHHIYAGPNSGKTWVALRFIGNAIERGQTVALFDTENGRRIVAQRLAALGVDPARVDQCLWYFPSLSLELDAATAFAAFLNAVKPDLVVFDSWLDHLASAGLDENSATNIAEWAACYSRPARDRGCAVVLLDHVPHGGGHARGSTRKKDEVDVQWRLSNPKRFDRQRVGEIVLNREKDREAALPQEVRFDVGGSEDGFVFKAAGRSTTWNRLLATRRPRRFGRSSPPSGGWPRKAA